MDPLEDFLDVLRKEGHARTNFLGMLHVLIGRKIHTAEGVPVSTGMTWRDLATWLKQQRWDREAVRDLGLDPEDLSPRDRHRYWYQAIAQAGVDSAAAVEAGDRLARALAVKGFVISAAPHSRK